MYALLVPLVLLSAYSFLELLKNGEKYWWGIHIVVNTFIVWTHLFGVFFIAAEGCVWLIAQRSNVRRLLVWTIIHCALLIPLAIWVNTIDMPRLNVAASAIGTYNLRALCSISLIWAGGRLYETFNPAAYMPAHVSLDKLLAVLLFAFACWKTVSLAFSRGNTTGSQARYVLLFLLTWLLLPAISLFVLSRVIRPCLLGRYTLYSSIPLYILAGGGVSRLRWLPARVAVAGIVPALLGYQTLLVKGPLHLNWQAVVARLAAEATPDDEVYAIHDFEAFTIEFNARQMGATRLLSQIRIADAPGRFPALARKSLDSAHKVWLVIWQTDLTEFDAMLARQGLTFEKSEIPGGFPRLNLYHFPAQTVLSSAVRFPTTTQAKGARH